ncbi:MAG: diadenosine tetraphosphate hydrolase [Sphingobacteriaceae bacterium]|jgi:diadenosine tetraphosphate (Ap4A) HIT family hydrolase|nr:diadenosine tetraphosphate hydrolase [Sphingobacteriaceae bacterium]
MKDFTGIAEERVLYRDKFFFIIKDDYPVSPGHLLIISNEVKRDFFELSEEEKKGLVESLNTAKQLVMQEHTPDGFNIGMNCGESAGQTVFHFHCHLIPRYVGDMENPRGGVRHCILGKGYY